MTMNRRRALQAIAAGTTVALAAPGTAVAAPAKTSFRESDRIVFTYYFSWYNWPNPFLSESEHLLAGSPSFDYLTVHPGPQTVTFDRNPDYRKRRPANCSGLPLLSYGNKEWHKAEIRKMTTNGIDVLAFDFWGFSNTNAAPRSLTSAATLNAAMNDLDRTGTAYPAVALFLETVPFGVANGDRGTDLSTEAGALRFYNTIASFFSSIDKRRWLLIDDRAVVILYASGIDGLKISPYGIRRCRELFQRTFGKGLVFMGSDSWQALTMGEVRYSCKWGAAMRQDRLVENTSLMQIAPGYNYLGNTRGCPRSVDAYRAAWERARRTGKNWIAVETWNEWHEGTGVATTVEDGNAFLDITQSQARRFKSRQ